MMRVVRAPRSWRGRNTLDGFPDLPPIGPIFGQRGRAGVRIPGASRAILMFSPVAEGRQDRCLRSGPRSFPAATSQNHGNRARAPSRAGGSATFVSDSAVTVRCDRAHGGQRAAMYDSHTERSRIRASGAAPAACDHLYMSFD